MALLTPSNNVMHTHNTVVYLCSLEFRFIVISFLLLAVSVLVGQTYILHLVIGLPFSSDEQ